MGKWINFGDKDAALRGIRKFTQESMQAVSDTANQIKAKTQEGFHSMGQTASYVKGKAQDGLQSVSDFTQSTASHLKEQIIRKANNEAEQKDAATKANQAQRTQAEQDKTSTSASNDKNSHAQSVNQDSKTQSFNTNSNAADEEKSNNEHQEHNKQNSHQASSTNSSKEKASGAQEHELMEKGQTHSKQFEEFKFTTAQEQEKNKRAAVKEILSQTHFSYLYLLARFNLYVLGVMEDNKVLALHPYPLNLSKLDKENDVIAYPQEMYVLKAKGQSSIGDGKESTYSFFVMVPPFLPEEVVQTLAGTHHTVFKDKEHLLLYIANYLQRALQVILGRFDLNRELHRRDKLSVQGPFELLSFEDFYYAELKGSNTACFLDNETIEFGDRSHLKQRFLFSCEHSITSQMSREMFHVQLVERTDIEWQQINEGFKRPYYFLPHNTRLNELELETILYIASVDMTRHNSKGALAAYQMLLRLNDPHVKAQAHLRLASAFSDGYLSHIEPIKAIEHTLMAFKLLGSQLKEERTLVEQAITGNLDLAKIMFMLEREAKHEHNLSGDGKGYRVSGLLKIIIALNQARRALKLGVGRAFARHEFANLLKDGSNFVNNVLSSMNIDVRDFESPFDENVLAKELHSLEEITLCLEKDYHLSKQEIVYMHLICFSILVYELKLNDSPFVLPSMR